jgi:hypothetical protein
MQLAGRQHCRAGVGNLARDNWCGGPQLQAGTGPGDTLKRWQLSRLACRASLAQVLGARREVGPA